MANPFAIKFTGQEEIIFSWIVPEQQRDPINDIETPDEYRVVRLAQATGGVVVYARYGGDWFVNPWNTRTLIAHLVSQQKETNVASGDLDSRA